MQLNKETGEATVKGNTKAKMKSLKGYAWPSE